ncbi:hypothetical protein ACFOZ5_09615 [Marinobacter lacisalsi]|uniref:DUF2157 domain-containing protein n=1 Tax=Marinobacter lacisalsi TaxID=475979 RepID=A0ABV8QGY3_9GAMM
MQVSPKEVRLLGQAIEHWQAEGLVSDKQANALRDSLEVSVFDWKRVAKYAFWLALACIVIAVSAVLADRWLVQLFERLFSASDWVKCVAFVVIAAVFYGLGVRRKYRWPEKRFSNEAMFFLGVIATALAIGFLGEAISSGSDHFSLLLLLAAVLYGLLGLWFPSTLVWVFALLSLGSWFGAETGYLSGWGAYYLGMNVPLRFVFFGLVLILAGSYVFRKWQGRQAFLKPTRAVGLLYLFIALWLMSIFGNYGDVQRWQAAGQLALLHWSVLFALAALASIYHGVRHDDAMTRGFGLTFLFINLYTRFFEFFWDGTHKAIFFGVLAVSFWYLGTRAERIWQMSALPRLACEREKPGPR